MSDIPTGIPTGIPTSIPTTNPTSLPTMIPTFNITTIDDDKLLNTREDDDIEPSIIAAIVIGSFGISYIIYMSYQMFGSEIHKKLRRWYHRKKQNDNLARIMPV